KSYRPLALLLSSLFACSETLLSRLLVASQPVRDLLLCAKHLFVAAIRNRAEGSRTRLIRHTALRTSRSPPQPPQSPGGHQVQNLDLSQRFRCRGLWGVGFNEQIFGADEQNRGRGQSDPGMFGPTVSPQLMQSGKGRIASDPALLTCPGRQWLGPFCIHGSNE